jgi:coproporphyrinogen III oxidase
MKDKFSLFIEKLQQSITKNIEKLEKNSKFKKDFWKRPNGGGGLTMVLEDGNVFEKAGVNVSKVYGELPDSISKIIKTNHSDFFACGISLILHPKNPMVPTFHANLRYFELFENNELKDSWFGGGLDLTPYYLYEEDIIHFHKICKKICDKYGPKYYETFKEKCDQYFWNFHRNEARGVGGLFFDYCRADNKMSIENWFSYVCDLGNSFLDCYFPIVEKRKNFNYNQQQLNWQQIRRGRYVEFNLLHDKGTLFGLKTNGRIESILISMPPKAKWVYDMSPIDGSEEDKLLKILKSPKKWI